MSASSKVQERKNIERLSSAIVIVGIIVGILVSIFLVLILYGSAIWNAIFTRQPYVTVDLVNVSDGQVVQMQTLQPKFRITVDPRVSPDSIEFYIDDSRNIMADPFTYDIVSIAVKGERLSIHPKFSLFPRLHEIRIAVPVNGSKRMINKKLIYAYADDFSSHAGFESFWGTSDKWYITQDGKLRTDIGKDKYISDISFRRSFPNDVVIEFGFIPFSDAVNISVFLGEGFSFFIGDGDSVTVRLKKAVKLPSGGKTDVTLKSRRLPFRLEKNKSYRARVIRIKNRYRIFVSDKPELPIEERHLVFDVIDKEPETRIVERYHTVGFAVWRGMKTTGAMFDNVVIYEPSKAYEAR